MSNLPSGLFVPEEFPSVDHKKQYLHEVVFRKDDHARDAQIPLMNGGMSVGITDEPFVEAMARQNVIGVYGASAPGWRETQQDLSHLSVSTRKAFLREANRKAIESAADHFRERCETAIRGANVMKILGDYEGTLEDLIKSKQFDILFVGAGIPDDLPAHMMEEDCKDLFYVPIVSPAMAAKAIRRKIRQLKSNARWPDAFYLELPNKAGGHLGAIKGVSQACDDDQWDPVTICEEIWKIFPNTPIIIAGGIAYRDQIISAYDMANGASMGTRLLATQESGMPDDIIKSVYLNRDVPVRVDAQSSTGFPSRRLDIPTTERTSDTVRSAIRNCISCVRGNKKECQFLLQAKESDPEDPHYCVRRELIDTRSGVARLCFTGSQIVDMRGGDNLYRPNGRLQIPTIEETLEFTLTNNAPQNEATTHSQSS